MILRKLLVAHAGLLVACATSCDGPDAARPPRSPTTLEAHPGVVCESLGALVYTPPPRPASVAGDVLWTTDVEADPAIVGALAPYAFAPASMPLTGTIHGGLSFWVANTTRGVLTLDAAGHFVSYDVRSLEQAHALVRIGDVDELLFSAGGSLYPTGNSTIERTAIDPILRPTGAPYDGRAQASSPVYFPDEGTVVWLSHPDVIQSNCVQTGQLRWAVEYEPRLRTFADLATPPPQQIIGLSDGSTVVQTAEAGLARIASDGTLMGSRYQAEGVVLTLAEGCGALIADGESAQEHYSWWSFDDFATTATFPGLGALPAQSPGFLGGHSVLADCTVVIGRVREDPGSGETITEMLGVDRDGHSWVTPLPRGWISHPAIPLADGGLVVIQGRAGGFDVPLRITVLETTGEVRWSQTYDPTVGDALVERATVLMPDGVLYALTTTGTFVDYHFRLTAFDIGTPAGGFSWKDSGTNWARTGTRLAPGTPRADGGPAPLDAGVDAGG